ncbi:unnamed protein product [Echinostoma caproni]|uniref:DUF3510 domain-containing protein n=1 Tax=Echinostoma caproni TaxID=27848 RepID=A0A183B708_9TREM|nr:unnamed protein product [Echinostoma caproni]
MSQGLNLTGAQSTSQSNTDDGRGLLTVSNVLMTQLERCWQDGIYLVNLRHRFWRLTLQLLSRYCSFVTRQISSHQTPTEPQTTSTPSTSNLKPLLFLLVDCFQLIAYVRVALPAHISSKLGTLDTAAANESPSSFPTWLTECLEEVCERIHQTINPLQSLIVDQLLRSCLNFSRQILDVPRQYRRTNRSLPTTSSTYVSAMIDPLSELGDLCRTAVIAASCAKPALEQLINRAVTQLSEAFPKAPH